MVSLARLVAFYFGNPITNTFEDPPWTSEIVSYSPQWGLWSEESCLQPHIVPLLKWKTFSSVQLFATPWTIQPIEFSRPEYWSGWPFPSLGDLPNTGIKPSSPASQVESLLTFSSVQSRSQVQLFVTPWIAACQASLSITNSRSSLRLMSMESVMPFSHLILCHPLLLLPSIFPSVRVFSNESVLHIRWPKYWSFSFSINPSNEFEDWFPLGWTGWISLLYSLDLNKSVFHFTSKSFVQIIHQLIFSFI